MIFLQTLIQDLFTFMCQIMFASSPVYTWCTKWEDKHANEHVIYFGGVRWHCVCLNVYGHWKNFNLGIDDEFICSVVKEMAQRWGLCMRLDMLVCAMMRLDMLVCAMMHISYILKWKMSTLWKCLLFFQIWLYHHDMYK